MKAWNWKVLVVACACALCVLALSACGGSAGSSQSSASGSASVSASSASASSAASSATSSGKASSSSSTTTTSSSALTFPTAWLAAGANGVPAATPVNVLRLPGIDVKAHRGGRAISSSDQKSLDATWPETGEGEALVEYQGTYAVVDADLLLVNLPDIMPDAVFDVVYSYSSTSQCAGHDIPGVTGESLPGYANGKQQNDYLGKQEFVAPCAYPTAIKALQAEAALKADGYRLLVYDAYRPMSAQNYLSDAFQSAVANDSAMQASLGAWSMQWYVANGASGHNYGADLDVGVCDKNGNPIEMPSAFDAFDETGHLTKSPIDSGDITPAEYRSAVSDNPACMALHKAFVDAGFSEMASEWWHFGDGDTESLMRSMIGTVGLDFTATL